MPRSPSKSNASSPLQKNQQPTSLTAPVSGGAKGRSIIRIGPAGWSYPDWSGYVYPKRPKGFHEATFLAQFFDAIEINTSFYAPMRADHARQWIDRVSANPRFRFTAKLWQKFTHDAIVTPSVITPADEHAVREGFDVLHQAGKIGAVLLQFPFSFHRDEETTAYLRSASAIFRLPSSRGTAPRFLERRRNSGHPSRTSRGVLQHRSAGHWQVHRTRRRGDGADRIRALARDGATIRGSAMMQRFLRTSATTTFTRPKSSTPMGGAHREGRRAGAGCLRGDE